MNKKKIISEFNLVLFGNKGWYHGDLACPECGGKDKFGIFFTENSAITHCFYCSIKDSLYNLLQKIGRQDLIEYDKEYVAGKELSGLKEEIKNKEEREIKLPIGFKRIYDDEYLNSRGFNKIKYDSFEPGISDIDPAVDNKIIFKIFQNKKLKGWLARSKFSKEWHYDNLLKHKEFGERLILRYRNSNNDFSHLLGGLDDINEETSTVILVEGLFDKINVDKLLNLDENDGLKCCFTFGDDISNEQVELIPKSVDNIILMYDYKTIRQMKSAAGKLSIYFNVKVAVIDDPNIDPGNMDIKYFQKIFYNLNDYIYFYSFI